MKLTRVCPLELATLSQLHFLFKSSSWHSERTIPAGAQSFHCCPQGHCVCVCVFNLALQQVIPTNFNSVLISAMVFVHLFFSSSLTLMSCSLQMFKIPYRENVSVDRKPAAVQWLRHNVQSAHHVLEFEDLVEGKGVARCCWHKDVCSITEGTECDLIIAGRPCTPFPLQKANRCQTRFQSGVIEM